MSFAPASSRIWAFFASFLATAYVSVDDEETLNKVFEMFKEKFKDEIIPKLLILKANIKLPQTHMEVRNGK